jgi:hypothetical protein
MKQKLADIWNLLYGFRNDIIWLLLFCVSIIFRLKNYIDGSQWVDLTKNTFLGIAAVRGTEHLVSVVSDYVTTFKGGNAANAAPPTTPVPQGDNLVEGDGK